MLNRKKDYIKLFITIIIINNSIEYFLDFRDEFYEIVDNTSYFEKWSMKFFDKFI